MVTEYATQPFNNNKKEKSIYEIMRKKKKKIEKRKMEFIRVKKKSGTKFVIRT